MPRMVAGPMSFSKPKNSMRLGCVVWSRRYFPALESAYCALSSTETRVPSSLRLKEMVRPSLRGWGAVQSPTIDPAADFDTEGVSDGLLGVVRGAPGFDGNRT